MIDACLEQPRTYTRSFAVHMTKIMQPMKLSPDVELSDSPPAAKLAHLWRQTEGLGPDLWEDAGVPALLRYLMGCKHLEIPAEWEWLLAN